MRRFTSSLPICDTVKTHRSATKKMRKNDGFCLFSKALQQISTVSQIGEREVNLRIISHLFRIRYFVVLSISKYLIAREVLMGVARGIAPRRHFEAATDFSPCSRHIHRQPATNPAKIIWGNIGGTN